MEERRWASRSPSSAAAAPTRRSSSRASCARARPAADRRAGPARHRPRAPRDVVGGLAQRMLARLDWTGRLTAAPATATAAIDGADFVLIQLRVGGQATRLVDETLPPTVRGHRPGDDRARAASPRRCGPCPWSSSSPSDRAAARAHRARGSSTSPTRSGSSPRRCSTHGHRALGLCNVAINIQRAHRRAASASAGRGGARARRAQPPELGARGPGRRRRPAAGAARANDADGWPSTSAMPVELVRTLRRDPVLLPALLLRDAPRSSPSSATATPGRRRSSTSRRAAARDVPGPGAGREAGAARRPRRRLLQRGGRAADRVAPRRRGRRPGRRHAQRRGPARPARRRRRRDPGEDRPRRRPRPAAGAARARDARPGPGGQGVRGADRGGSLQRRPANGAARAHRQPAGRRLGDRGAAPGALLEANRTHLPRFFR